MSRSADRRWMRLALSLGRRGQGRVWPNPAVGCVIVRDDRVVGRGWTADGGRPHAEVVALAQAGELARGSDVFVTLEPCAHVGRSGPCAAALIEAGVGRVVVACGDPDPRVAGRGLAMLREAGISVEVGLCEAEAVADHAGFFGKLAGRPFVTLKLASTLDGKIATGSGESKWITGSEARRAVHGMRARHDAVMVGAGTVRADDPGLTVRGVGISRQPVRVVLSRGLDLPLDGQLARTAGEVPVWLCHSQAAPELVSAWEGLGAVCVPCESRGGRVSVPSALAALAEKGITRVFCEGGGSLASALLKEGLVDELVGFVAGKVIGAEGRPSVGALGLDMLADAPRFELLEARSVGADVMMRWRRPRSSKT